MSKIVKPGDPNPIVHRSKFFKGRKTAEEVHREFGMRMRCAICDGPPVIMVRMLALIADIKKHSPEYWATICASAAQNGRIDDQGNVKVPYIETTYGKMIRFSSAAACAHHRKELEQTAAKAPSWVLVEIDRGPGADKPMVQVVSG